MPIWRLKADPSRWTLATLGLQTIGDNKEERHEAALPKQPPMPLTMPASNVARWDTTREIVPLDDEGPLPTSSTSTRKASTMKQWSAQKKPPHKGESMRSVKS